MKSYKKGFDAFVEKANKIYNNKYTYVRESYINNPDNYIITFQNNKRLFDNRSLPDGKVVTLEYYGQSFIQSLDNK